jgi:Na+-driven multidrug efflux pump
MSVFALGAAIEITTGQNLGAKQIDRIFAYHRSAIKQISILMLGLGVLVFFFGNYFAQIFTNDPNILKETHVYMKITAFSYIPFAIGMISTRVISGAGDTFRSLVLIALILFIVQLPLAYALSKWALLNENGIWYGILISQVAFAFVGYYNMKRKKWMRVKV